MDPITRKLVETVRLIVEKNNTTDGKSVNEIPTPGRLIPPGYTEAPVDTGMDYEAYNKEIRAKNAALPKGEPQWMEAVPPVHLVPVPAFTMTDEEKARRMAQHGDNTDFNTPISTPQPPKPKWTVFPRERITPATLWHPRP